MQQTYVGSNFFRSCSYCRVIFCFGSALIVMLFVALTSSKYFASRNPTIEPGDGNTFQQSQCLGGEERQDWPHGLCFQR